MQECLQKEETEHIHSSLWSGYKHVHFLSLAREREREREIVEDGTIV